MIFQSKRNISLLKTSILSLSESCQVVLKKTQLTIPLVLSTDKCKQFPFSGTVSNNVWRPTKEGSPLFIPRIFISGWKEAEILSSHTFLPTLLSLWVGNAIKTLRFLPTNSRSSAYHCLSEGKKLTLKIREGQ